MKLCLYLVLILSLIYEHCQIMTALKEDPRFPIYKKCLKNYIPLLTYQLHGPQYNGSYYEIFNFRINKLYPTTYPIAIFTPLSEKEVSIAVKCGVEINIQLLPISGGHSYAGLSYGTNDSVTIDFRYMDGISINHKEMEVSVESGTFLGSLHSTLWKSGGLGAPLGACATVAIGGLALGGGIGYFSNLYGLVIDNLVEINMVDARGDAVLVNKTHNEDLWWALRGVGPGYVGLVTSIKMKVFRANELKLTFLKLRYHNKSFKNVMDAYIKWLTWVRRNDPSIASVIQIHSDKHENVKKHGWPGIEVQILQVKDPKIKTTGKPHFLDESRNIFPVTKEFSITFPSYIEFVVTNDYTSVANKPHSYYVPFKDRFEFSKLSKEEGVPRYFYAKSFFVNKSYHAANLKEAEKVLLEIPNDAGIFINSEQGAISKRHANESAFVHRDNLFNLKVFVESVRLKDIAPGKKWMKKFLKSIQFLDSGRTYQNYPDRDLADYLNRYYGSNLEKLIGIKRKWDPKGYFNSKMSIPIN